MREEGTREEIRKGNIERDQSKKEQRQEWKSIRRKGSKS